MIKTCDIVTVRAKLQLQQNFDLEPNPLCKLGGIRQCTTPTFTQYLDYTTREYMK